MEWRPLRGKSYSRQKIHRSFLQHRWFFRGKVLPLLHVLEKSSLLRSPFVRLSKFSCSWIRFQSARALEISCLWTSCRTAMETWNRIVFRVFILGRLRCISLTKPSANHVVITQQIECHYGLEKQPVVQVAWKWIDGFPLFCDQFFFPQWFRAGEGWVRTVALENTTHFCCHFLQLSGRPVRMKFDPNSFLCLVPCSTNVRFDMCSLLTQFLLCSSCKNLRTLSSDTRCRWTLTWT